MKKKQLLSKHAINRAADKCANQIDNLAYCQNKDVVLIGILNGAIPFMSSVMQRINSPIIIDTIRCKSYNGIFNKTKVKMTKKPEVDLSNKTVVLIDDIVDTGDTIRFIQSYIINKYTNVDIKICSLLKRQDCDIYIDYLGRVIPKGMWVYGYGMDNDQFDRNLQKVMYNLK